MYCTKCGTKLDGKENVCQKCNEAVVGQFNTTKKSNKVISILGLVFSFIIPILGLILSIIGLSKGNKINKETGEKNKYIVLNIIGIVMSIIIFIISIIIIFVGIFIFVLSNNISKPEGKWQCGSYTNYASNPAVSLNFNKNKTFSWSKYGDEENNSMIGKYTYNSVESNSENLSKYSIILNVEAAKINGINSDIKNKNLSGKITLNKNNSDIMNIYIYNSLKTYYCKKID